MTEEEEWAHTKDNAAVDLRRHLRRTLYALIGFLATAAAVTPFFYGNPLHEYWSSIGRCLLLVSMILWLLLILEAATAVIGWNYVRELKKIDKRYGPSE